MAVLDDRPRGLERMRRPSRYDHEHFESSKVVDQASSTTAQTDEALVAMASEGALFRVDAD